MKLKQYKIYGALIFILFINSIPIYSKNFSKVKILIASAQKISLILKGKFKLLNGFTEQKIIENNNIHLIFLIKENKIKIENYGIFSGTIYIKNLSNGIVSFNNYIYSGDFYITLLTNRLFLINEISVEEYLKGVLPNEISPNWNIEAIKAQAVAARTFAYFYKLKNLNQLYHLNATILSQVYTGKTGEKAIFNKAIQETQDEVLVFNNRLIAAYFHSVCGGHTEDAEKVWGRKLPYLRGVPCNYCRNAKHYRWQAIFTDKEIISKLNKSGFNITHISRIVPGKISSSGRWVSVRIIGKPHSITVQGNMFRLILGAEKLRSTKFRISHYKDKWIVKGKGWGHGVGMCQWGAKGMADRGYKYYQILRYYFRGTKLVKISEKYLSNITQ